MDSPGDAFVAECFWPGVSSADVEALDRRVHALTGPEQPVRYLGSILIREDEVVLCQFEGGAAAVRESAERAGVPFTRILAVRLSA
jgi:hypothetical protein